MYTIVVAQCVFMVSFSKCLCVQGKEGFKNARKGTSVAAQTTGTSAAIVSSECKMCVCLIRLGLFILI